MATGSKAVRANTDDDVTYCKARLAFTDTVLAALGDLRLALQKAVSDFDRAHSRRNPQRSR